MTAQHRRRSGSPWVLLLLVVPFAEIVTITAVGRAIGFWWTLFLLVASGIVGAWLIAREGRRAWSALRESVGSGRMPARELADGVLVVVGGALMILPGFVTDVLGLLLVLPFTRPAARALLGAFVARRVMVIDAQHPDAHGPTAHRPGPPADGPVVRGDVVD